MVEMVVEEEVVGDNATSDSATFDVFDGFENIDNVELVMSESVPSSDNLVDEDVVEGTDLVMGDFVPPSDQISHSLLVPIHLLDDDQEVDADELIFENNKHDFITTHDPFLNGKLDVINTIDEDIWKHPDMLPFNPSRLENLYWHCKPKLQTEDDTWYTGKMKSTRQLLGAALGTLHVKPVILKRYRGRTEHGGSKLLPSTRGKSSENGNWVATGEPTSHSTQESLRSSGSAKGRWKDKISEGRRRTIHRS
ncbi:hypothetical protein L2E82_44259 [Cichorium intybus]|uniref:Uncharacterized protein n=1 Tax=Cichorium intybus TaxID=13427 RepID=A0ACB8ZQ31_CICIN|nr:hypothetical protein L2E82_44259 [Cichorium intybus]